METNAELYAEDFFAWTQTTAALIRAGKWYDIALQALAVWAHVIIEHYAGGVW